MNECIFCRIARGDFNTPFVYEDDQVVAFKDLHPQAPVHALVIPRQHFASIREVKDEAVLGHLLMAGNIAAEKMGLTDYRFVINTGSEAGQTVFHVHLHILGGRIMGWPPG